MSQRQDWLTMCSCEKPFLSEDNFLESLCRVEFVKEFMNPSQGADCRADDHSSAPARKPWSDPMVMTLDVAMRTNAFGTIAIEPGANCSTNSAVSSTAVPCS